MYCLPFVDDFRCFFAKKGWLLQKLARGVRPTQVGTFDFWVKPGLGLQTFGNAGFWRRKAPKTIISLNLFGLGGAVIA